MTSAVDSSDHAEKSMALEEKIEIQAQIVFSNTTTVSQQCFPNILLTSVTLTELLAVWSQESC